VRDYIHVADLARAHVLALKHLDHKEPAGLSVNLGTGKGHSILDILSVAENITGKKITRRLAALREGDPAELVADPSFAKAILRWEPVYADIASIIRHAWNFHQKSAENGKVFS
jgi:UDP-glucose 4-epimerase